jgi:hypothetical protein
LSNNVNLADLTLGRSVRSDPAWCTPLSLLAVKEAIGGESWTGVNGTPAQPVTTLTVRYADAARVRRELLDKRVALVRCSTVRLTFPPFDVPPEEFSITGRQWQRFLLVIVCGTPSLAMATDTTSMCVVTPTH